MKTSSRAIRVKHVLKRRQLNSLQHIFSVVICEAVQPPENGSISYNKSLVRNGGYPVDTLASFMCQIVVK